MTTQSSGPNRVEVRLAFTSDASKATSEMQKISAAAKNVDQAAKEAQKAMDRMNGPSGASKIPAPAFPTTVKDSQGNTHSVQAWQSAQKRMDAAKQREDEAKAMKAMGGGGQPTNEPNRGMAELFAKGALALNVIGGLTKGLETLANVSGGTRSKVLGLTETIPVVGTTAAALSRSVLNMGESKIRGDLATAERVNAVSDAKKQVEFTGEQRMRSARQESVSTVEQARSGSPSYFFAGLNGENEGLAMAKMNEERARRAAARAVDESNRFGTVEEIGRKSDARAGTNVRESNVGVEFFQAKTTTAETAIKQRSQEDASKPKSFYQRNAPVIDALTLGPVGMLAKTAFGGYSDRSPLKNLPQQEDVADSRKDLGRALVQQEEVLRQAKEKQISAAQKLNEYEKARTETMKAQGQMLKEQYATAKSQEKSFGMMGKEDQQNVLETLRQAKEQGFGSLSEEQRGLLSSNAATSKFADTEAGKIGESNAVLEEIRKLTGDRSSKAIGEDLQNIQAQINAKIDIDEDALAEKIANIMGKFIGKLETIISKQTGNASAQLDAEYLKQRALQEAS